MISSLRRARSRLCTLVTTTRPKCVARTAHAICLYALLLLLFVVATNVATDIVPACKRSFGQGNIFRSVCQEFCPQGVGGCLSACWDTTPPLGAGAPWTRHPPDQGRPRPDTPRRDPPGTRHPPPSAEHAGKYSQRAGGTHPTGMKSCSFLCR